MLRVRHTLRSLHAHAFVMARHVQGSARPRLLTTLAQLVEPGPTVDHLMSVERAAQLMAERKVDALPVTKDNKVVGMFTEHDYFKKVLKDRTQGSKQPAIVSEVATMGPDLVVAGPQDTVEGSLELMARKKVRVLPVVKQDGHIMGTVSVADLAQHYYEDALKAKDTAHVVAPELLPGIQLHGEPELVAAAFSEASVFPEYTPIEDVLVAEAQEALAPSVKMSLMEYLRAEWSDSEKELLGQISMISVPPDYPEGCNPVERAIEAKMG